MNDSLDRQDAQQAQAALDEAATRRIDSPHDRRVHGLATAGFGILVAIFVMWIPLDGTVGFGVYALLLMALGLWQARAALSTPRWAKVTGYVGLAVMIVVLMVAIAVRNMLEADGDLSVPVQLAATVLIALPMLVAGGLVLRGRR